MHGADVIKHAVRSRWQDQHGKTHMLAEPRARSRCREQLSTTECKMKKNKKTRQTALLA